MGFGSSSVQALQLQLTKKVGERFCTVFSFGTINIYSLFTWEQHLSPYKTHVLQGVGCSGWLHASPGQPQALEVKLSSCGTWEFLFCGMWNLRGPGVGLVSSALMGGFLSTVPPGKSQEQLSLSLSVCLSFLSTISLLLSSVSGELSNYGPNVITPSLWAFIFPPFVLTRKSKSFSHNYGTKILGFTLLGSDLVSCPSLSQSKRPGGQMCADCSQGEVWLSR